MLKKFEISMSIIITSDGWRMKVMVNVMISGSVCQKVMGDVGCMVVIAK